MLNSQRCLSILACLTTVFIFSARVSFGQVTDDQVNETIAKMKEYLYTQQDPRNGSWERASLARGMEHDVTQAGGETALVVQALLVAGDSPQHPPLAQALDLLSKSQMQIVPPSGDPYTLNLFRGTYAVSVRAHVWSYLPPKYVKMLKMDAKWLHRIATTHKQGLIGYHDDDTERVDHSVLQYAMLGLWQASKRGIPTPKQYWDRWARHFLSSQLHDGGWSYRGADDKLATGSMTAAGLTALFLARLQLHRDRHSAEPHISEAIERGLAWLNQRFDGPNNPGADHYPYYYLYGIERVGLMSGIRYLNGRDWYKTGADHIVKHVAHVGSVDNDIARTAFALMFLARGRYPVWINKLEFPGDRWNNHPADVYTLTNNLSDQLQREVNWQVVSIETPPEEWLAAPVAYLASDRPLELEPRHEAAIKRYLDLGGLIIASADRGSKGFIDSVHEIMGRLYPDFAFRQLAHEHHLMSTWRKLPAKAVKRVTSLSNGTRELVFLVEDDLSYALQADKKPGVGPQWQLAHNLFAYATGKTPLPGRLRAHRETQLGRARTGEMIIGRATINDVLPSEPATWEVFTPSFYNRTGIDITPPAPPEGSSVSPVGSGSSGTRAPAGSLIDLSSGAYTAKDDGSQATDLVPLFELGECDYKLVHMTGSETVTLTRDQIDAIRRYADRGGTLLIETVSGHGRFSRDLLTQLATVFTEGAQPLGAQDAIISGRDLQGGFDTRRALFRPHAILTLKLPPKPDLIAYFVKGRPAVIFSHHDLSLGLLGVHHDPIIGYQSKTAREIMTNITIWASKQHLSVAR